VNGTEQPDTRTAAGKCFLDMLQHRSQRGPYLFLFAPAELCKCLEVFGERSGHAVCSTHTTFSFTMATLGLSVDLAASAAAILLHALAAGHRSST
jgi:hypothetical protein